MSARVWDWEKWGTWADPIHKSDLNGIVGKFGCTEQFRRKKEERATGLRVYEKAGGKILNGNAVHNVIARLLRSTPARMALLDPKQHFARASVDAAFDEEFERERAGRDVDWYRDNPDKCKAEMRDLLFGWTEDFHKHVAEVVLVEAGFVWCLDGIWLTGMTDLVYRPVKHPDKLALSDWKTGAQKPHTIDLDHGWESGIYSGAINQGWFVPGESVMSEDGIAHRDSVERVCIQLAQRWDATIRAKGQSALPGIPDAQQELDRITESYGARYFGEFPEEIRHVHLRDYIPYSRKTTKMLSRPEDLEWAGLARPEKSTFEKGDTRGPAWLHVTRSENDIVRLRHLLHNVVKWVRQGLFVAAPGEMCSRCKFREPCLNDGYQPIGESAERLKRHLATYSDDFDGMDFDGDV